MIIIFSYYIDMGLFDLDKLEKYSRISILECERDEFTKDLCSLLKIINSLDSVDI